MFTPSKNSKIASLTLTHRLRHINLSDLPIEVIDGKKCCIWCLTPLTGKKYKWCSDECNNHALSWSRPQKEQNLLVILHRQGYLCNGCQYDYNPIVDAIVAKSRKNYKIKSKNEINFYLGKLLKRNCEDSRKPEVDHIVRVKDGGQVLGNENHQILCVQCHKTKTKLQNSGPRTKK